MNVAGSPGKKHRAPPGRAMVDMSEMGRCVYAWALSTPGEWTCEVVVEKRQSGHGEVCGRRVWRKEVGEGKEVEAGYTRRSGLYVRG